MKVTTIAAALLLAAAAIPARAQSLYYVSVVKTEDIQIGNGARANQAAMLDLMRGVADTLHLRLQGTQASLAASGKNFNCDNISHAVDTIKPGPNDILVFYYAGHGERVEGDPSPLPTMSCWDIDDPRPRITLQDMVHRLAAKNARLTIVIADLCNKALPAFEQQQIAAAIETDVAQAYRRLLLQSAGMIVLDSSSPGEFSWYRPGGSDFTNQFIANLMHPPGGAAATWDSFVASVTAPIHEISARVDDDKGHTILAAGQQILQSPQALLRLTALPQ